jgi:putative oxidoreductase
MSEPRGAVATSIGLLVLRLGAGGLLFCGHGWGKLIHYGDRAAGFSDPLGVGPAMSLGLVIFAEVVCTVFVALGFFTRLSVIPIIVFLMVAGFIQHAYDPWPRRELAFIYAVPFIALLFAGAGRFSLDARMGPLWPSDQDGRPH